MKDARPASLITHLIPNLPTNTFHASPSPTMLTFLAPTPIPRSRQRPPPHAPTKTLPVCTTKPPPHAPPSEPSTHLPGAQLHAPARLSDLHDVRAYPSPLLPGRPSTTFIHDQAQVLRDIILPQRAPLAAFVRAGPRKHVVFPAGVRAAVVSCGGLCPGINTVIKELFYALKTYRAAAVYGVKHGFRGFYEEDWVVLDDAKVDGIHHRGGSVLGSSRGGFELERIVGEIERRAIDMVFVIGGDGTIMGCQKIFEEVCRRNLKCAVVSVPKTIDNDIAVIDCSFGTCPCPRIANRLCIHFSTDERLFACVDTTLRRV